MPLVVIVYHSGSGHTKLMAEAVREGAAAVAGTRVELFTTDEAGARLDDLDRADAIVLGCPTYMGSMSAEMKKFLELASPKWSAQAWKDKIAGAFTNSSSFSGDKVNTLVGLVIHAMQHGMIYVGTGLLPAASDRESLTSVTGPGPDATNRVGSFLGPAASSFRVKPPAAPPKGDLETARLYGKRVAEITAQFARGRA
jgi:NAD(P)H dehydrogenase (quinone)